MTDITSKPNHGAQLVSKEGSALSALQLYLDEIEVKINEIVAAGIFRGAITKFTSAFSKPIGSSNIDWDATEYDTDSFWDIAQPARLTIPAGVTRVRLTAGMHDASSVTGQMIVSVLLNDTDFYSRNEIDTSGGDSASVATPVIDVVEGDYFTLNSFVTNARTLDANTSNYLSVEVVS